MSKTIGYIPTILAIYLLAGCGSVVSDTVDISTPGNDSVQTPTNPGEPLPAEPDIPPPPPVEQLLAEAINEGQFITFLELINAKPTLLTGKLIDEKESTALILAVRALRWKMIKVLLEKGATIDITDNSNQGALDYAELGPNPEIMKEFLLSGGDPDIDFLNQGLHASMKDLADMQLFLNLGADIDSAIIEEGAREAKPVIRKTIDLSNLELLQFLVKNNASLVFKARGREISALNYAQRTNSAGTKDEIISYLTNLGN